MSYKVGDFVNIRCKLGARAKENYRVEFPSGGFVWVNESCIQNEQKTYEDGLNDAWELARKINEISLEKRREILSTREHYLGDIIKNFTPQEALAKIESYEKSQQIQVGDVVYSAVVDSKEGICVGRGNDGQEYALVWFKEYDCPQNMSLKDLKKTGRHIDISNLLEQIRGDE